MRKPMLYVVAGLLAVLFVIPAMAADHPQKPGKWKMTMQVEIPNMPMKMPPINFEVCLTEEDLQDPQKAAPQGPKSDCKISDFEIDGNTVSYTMSCPKQKMTGRAKMTYTEDSFNGEIVTKVEDIESTTKMSGKWMGTCTK